jgi:hypothetical protein
MAQSLEQAHKVLVSVPASPIDLSNNMKVVYFTGMATTNEVLSDPLLGVSVKALRVQRKVEMYQWKEDVDTKTEKETGGSVKETKTYNYTPVWSDTLIDSREFREQAGHQNPVRMPFNQANAIAGDVTVGDFHIPPFLLDKLTDKKNYDFSSVDLAPLQARSNLKVQHDGENIYLGNDMNSPTVGDVKISVLVYAPQQVSVIAQQNNSSLQAYQAPAGKSIALLVSGVESPDKMILDAVSENRMMMWVWRAVSLVMMMIGIALILNPLVVLADVFPFIGNIVGFGTGLVAIVGGLMLWIVAVSFAWIFVRPLIAIAMLAVVAGIVFWVLRRKKHS